MQYYHYPVFVSNFLPLNITAFSVEGLGMRLTSTSSRPDEVELTGFNNFLRIFGSLFECFRCIRISGGGGGGGGRGIKKFLKMDSIGFGS